MTTPPPPAFAQLPAILEFDLALKDAVLAVCPEGPSLLREAMVHAVLKGGKRIRPLCCMAVAHALSVPASLYTPLALAVEFIHAQSLVHDDLPAMDNDDERRGLPTVHKQYGEATAILVGDALLAHAFALLAKPGPIPHNEQTALLFELSRTYQQLVSGQAMDLQPEGRPVGYIHQLKTGALFRFCFWSVATLAHADNEAIRVWAELGHRFGLLFQACDDWMDNPVSSLESSTSSDNPVFSRLREQAEELTIRLKALPRTEPVLQLVQRVFQQVDKNQVVSL